MQSLSRSGGSRTNRPTNCIHRFASRKVTHGFLACNANCWCNTDNTKDIQGWISDMVVDGPIFFQKVANFYHLKSRFVSKSWLFLIFKSILRADFFQKILVLSNQKSTFILVLAFLTCFFFHNFVQILFERLLFTKKTP